MHTLTVQQFPILASNPKTEQQLAKLLGFLNPMIAAATVANVQYQDVKRDISRLSERALIDFIGEPFFHAGRYALLPAEWRFEELTLVDARHLASRMTKVQKKQPEHAVKVAFLAVAAELVTVFNAVDGLKAKAVKRQTQPQEGEPGFVPPPPMSKTAQLVAGVLQRLTDSVKAEYEDGVFASLLSQITFIWNLKDGDPKRFAKATAGAPLFHKVANYDSVRRCFTSLKDDHEAIIRAEAHHQAELTQQTFLARNVAKIAKIVEDKGNLMGDPTILAASARRGMIEGTIRFDFEDGAKFTVITKIVQNRTQNSWGHVTEYTQYPVTFHNVALAGNAPMATPHSEKRMHEVFVK